MPHSLSAIAKAGGEKPFVSVFAHHADDDALYLYLLRIHEDRLHRRVGRLQTDAAARVAIKLLERDVGPAQQRNDHLAVVGGFPVFDHDEIAVADLLVDHGIAADAQHVRVALADEVFRHGDRFVRRDGFDWRTGRDEPEER